MESTISEILNSDMPDEIKADVFALRGMAGNGWRGDGLLAEVLRIWNDAKAGNWQYSMGHTYVDARCGSVLVNRKDFYNEMERVAKRMSILAGCKAPKNGILELPNEEVVLNELKNEFKGLEIENFEEQTYGHFSFTCNKEDYEGCLSEDIAEEKALDYLTDDDELWKMSDTHEGLEEWAQTVLACDGWENTLCRYDGIPNYLPCGAVYWRN